MTEIQCVMSLAFPDVSAKTLTLRSVGVYTSFWRLRGATRTIWRRKGVMEGCVQESVNLRVAGEGEGNIFLCTFKIESFFG